MGILRIRDLLKQRVLVTRDRARTIQNQLVRAYTEGSGEVVLDLRGVDGITPSFLDETLVIIGEGARAVSGGSIRVIVMNPPTQLSSKFVAVGRGHELGVEESADGAWIISEVEVATDA